MPALTREALYNRVWSEPVRAVAAAFSVSDVWLKKCCLRAHIPVPDRGYWTKLKAGKPVLKPVRPLRAPGMPEIVEIGGSSRAWRYDPAAQLAEPLPAAPFFTETLKDVETRTAKGLGKIVRSRDLASAVAPIRKLLQADEKRLEKQRETPWAASWHEPLFTSPFEQRRLRLLNAVAVGLAKGGGRLEVRDKAARDLCAVIGEQRLAFDLDHQQAKPSQHGERLTRKGAAGSLRLELKRRWAVEQSTSSWTDGSDGLLEDQLTEIVLAMIVAGEAEYRNSCLSWHEYLLERRLKDEAEVEKRILEAERREQERLVQEAQDRRDLLLSQAATWRSAQDIRGLVDALAAMGRRAEAGLDEWSRWALSEADALDPTLNGSLATPETGVATAPNDALA